MSPSALLPKPSSRDYLHTAVAVLPGGSRATSADSAFPKGDSTTFTQHVKHSKYTSHLVIVVASADPTVPHMSNLHVLDSVAATGGSAVMMSKPNYQ